VTLADGSDADALGQGRLKKEKPAEAMNPKTKILFFMMMTLMNLTNHF